VLIPKDNRKDLREVPRRVLKALRLVLVEHMDDVLREALALDDPEEMLGPRADLVEYRQGELYEPKKKGDSDPDPPPRPPPAGESAGEPAGLA